MVEGHSNRRHQGAMTRNTAMVWHAASPGSNAVKLPRRQFLHLAAGAAALPAVSRIARAQAYPARPVRLILGYAPGGAPDIVARLIGEWLSQRFGQPFIIENRPGGASNIGTEAAVRSSPDGYTLLYVTTANAINATLYDKLNFNFIRDIAPSRRHHPPAQPRFDKSLASGRDDPGPHRICQSQSGKVELWRAEGRHSPALRRIIQHDVRRQHYSGAL
jgi:hypothetical protein